MDIRYPATVEAQGDGSHLVQFVDLPHTFTEGQTKKEALFNAAEVLSAMLSWRLDEAKDVPPPSRKLRGAHYIVPDAGTQSAVLFHGWHSGYDLRPMPTKVKELIRFLEEDGWICVRQKGSHRQFHHASKPGTVTVAGKPSIEIPPGTLNSILKQAGLRK